MSTFVEHISSETCSTALNISKYKKKKKKNAYKTLKTVGVQIIMLKHPTKHKTEYP